MLEAENRVKIGNKEAKTFITTINALKMSME